MQEYTSIIPESTAETFRMKNKIKVFRAMFDLTQEALAKDLGVTRQTILAIEKGKYDPSLELAFKMARRFQTTVDEVFVYETE